MNRLTRYGEIKKKLKEQLNGKMTLTRSEKMFIKKLENVTGVEFLSDVKLTGQAEAVEPAKIKLDKPKEKEIKKDQKEEEEEEEQREEVKEEEPTI